MKSNRESYFDWAITLLLSAVAIFSIRSLFQSDSSRIISRDGNEYIQNDDNIVNLNSKIAQNEKAGKQHIEIVI